ncbi:MAG: PEP-CTERM sorting domain-containing protein [Planctomycetota bacterium]|jgi:hypothetical protein
MKKKLSVSIVAFLVVIQFLIGNTSVAAIVVYIDKNTFTSSSGEPQFFIDFETYGNSQPVSGEPSITGDEWLNFGIQFRPEDSVSSLILDMDNPQWQPASMSHGLKVWNSGGDISSIVISFIEPVVSIGMVICDSELADGYDERLEFFSEEDELLVSLELPALGYSSDGPEANYFRGVISDTPIAKVIMYENPSDNEGVPIDDIMYSVPEPATLLLLGLGGLALLRRRRA